MMRREVSDMMLQICLAHKHLLRNCRFVFVFCLLNLLSVFCSGYNALRIISSGYVSYYHCHSTLLLLPLAPCTTRAIPVTLPWPTSTYPNSQINPIYQLCIPIPHDSCKSHRSLSGRYKENLATGGGCF